MGAPREIRLAEPSEWREARDLRLEALRTDPLAFGSTLEREEAFGPEQWQQRVARNPEAPGCGQWIAVERPSRWIGTVSTALFQGELHVFAMWVRPAERGHGIGGQLLDAALTEIERARPGASVVLDVNPRQVAARTLYESRGFRPTGRTEPLGHTAGESVVEMRRLLGRP